MVLPTWVSLPDLTINSRDSDFAAPKNLQFFFQAWDFVAKEMFQRKKNMYVLAWNIIITIKGVGNWFVVEQSSLDTWRFW